jgi:predicted ATPase
MTTKVHARNYRSLGDVEVELGPLTVLVGPNGSGKSNFVDVLHFLTDAFTHGLQTAVDRRHGIAEVRRWAPRAPRSVAVHVGFEGMPIPVAPPSRELTATGHYSLEIGNLPEGQYEVRREHLAVTAGEWARHFEVARGKVIACSDASVVGSALLPSDLWAPRTVLALVPHVVRYIRSFGFYSIFPNVLREPQKPGTEWPLEPHGGNLASVLRGMRKANSEFLPEVARALGHVVPGIKDVKVSQVGGYLALKLLHDDGNGRRHWFDASQESDGTLRVLGILTALYQDPPPPLMAIEEPELTVHPGMLALLRDCIVEAAKKRTQIIITTHSPDLMSLFDVDVLRVVEMTDEGTKIGPVAEWQKQSIREQLFSTGELMRAEGLWIDVPAG